MREMNRILLFVAGVVFFAVAMGLTQMGVLIFLSPLVGLTGLFLLFWASLGKGLWCRTCKNFPVPNFGRK